MTKPVYVRDVQKYFKYRQVSGDESCLNRQIFDGNVERPGLELSGNFPRKPHKRIYIIGETEHRFIMTMSEQQQYKAFDFLTSERTPMILISRDLECPPILLQLAQQKNFPIFSSYAPTSTLIVEVVTFLEEYFTPVQSIHGVLIEVYGRGVLITGESGIGKSEIALELLRKGHILVADDRVEIFRLHNKVYGEAPDLLKNMMELRGVGVINVESMFGAASTQSRSDIYCVIELRNWDEKTEYDRIGLDNQHDETYFGVKIPKMIIPLRQGRSVAVIIEAAVINMIMRQKGYNSASEFQSRLTTLIQKNQESGD